MSLLYMLDLFGTFVFAITGAILGIRKNLDLFGVIVVGFVTAVGGGTLRDVILSGQPVFWLKDINYFLAIITGTILTFALGRRVSRMRDILKIADALGLGVFTVIGIQKGISTSLAPVFCIMMGITTAVAGGVVRDTLCQEIPMVLAREVYATACIAGGIIYYALHYAGLPGSISGTIAALVIIIVRLVAIRMNLSLPRRKGA